MPAMTDEEQKKLFSFLKPSDTLSNFDIAGSGTTSAKANGGFSSPTGDMSDFDKMKSGVSLDAPAPDLPKYGDQSFKSPQPLTPSSLALAPTDRGAADENNTEADDKIASSSPGHSPETLENATLVDPTATEAAGKMEEAKKFGPDEQKAVIDSILKSHGSFQNKASRGLAGLGDALMANAGKNSPGFLNQINEREARNDKMKAETTPQLQSMNQSKMGAVEKEEAQGADTPMVKAQRQVLLPIAKQLYPGKSESDYAAMLKLPGEFAKTAGIPTALLESKAKIAMANAEMSLHKEVAETNASNQKTERQLAAIKELNGMGIVDRALHGDRVKQLETIAKGSGGAPGTPSGSLDQNEVLRTVSGKPAIFDSTTRKFKRWQ